MPLSRFFHLLISLMLAGQMSAASIQWDAPRNITGPADVSTEGYYFGAWSPANPTIPVGTVNGVQMRGNDLEISSTGFDGAALAFGTHTTSDATYNNLLQYGTWSNGTSASFTINGTGRRPLTPGRQYLVQLWVSDARSYGLTRTETVSGSGTLAFQTANGMGQYVIGRFTADAASQTITLSANQSAQVNFLQVRDITPPEPETRQQRWKRLKYGIFSHYTYAMTGDANTAGERFNAEAYANDVAQAGAEYVVWTAWHSNTIPMFPSKAMDKYGFGGRYSERDTVSDMIDAVRAKGIRVFLYVHPFQPLIYETTGHNNFINELFAEVMDRYGPRIDGLWIDENQINGDQDSVVDYKRLMQTIKSRNPDIVTMQNGGQMYTVDLGGPETVNDWNFARWQCMYNFANPGNGPGAEDMLRTTVLNAAGNYDGGGIHWSIDGVVDGGLVETDRIFQLGQYIAPIRASICGTKPSASFPPPFTGEQIRYSNVNQYVATEALDDSKVYIHVLKPPVGTVLSLPNPVDGKIFSSARLLASGNPVGLLQDPYDGVRLRLQGSDTWDPLNTVIELTVASKGGAGHVNDTSGSVTYTGSSWIYQENRGNGEFANDVHLATTNGDSFTFTFSGTDVEYIATRGADRGQVEIYIDDVLETTVDLSTGTPGSRQVVFSKSGLPRGTHTLKGIKRGGTFMEVDCFKVTDLVNDSDPVMNGAYLSTTDYGTGVAGYGGPSNQWQPGYNGANWITPAVNYYPNNEPLNAPLTNEPVSDYFEFTFTGTGVQIPLSCAFSWAYFYMKVNGVFHSNVQVQQGQVSMFSVSGLPPGTHTVRGITWKATTDPSQPGVNGFTVTRSDIWNAASNRGFGELGDDVHYTDLNPGRFSWNFDGSGVEVITTRDSDARMAWFGVSGPGTSIYARLQNYSSQRQVGTTVFSLPNLPPGTHNLSVTHGANMSGLNFSFARLAIDGVRVYKGQSLAAPSLRWGATGAGGNGTWDTNASANWFNGSSAVKWPAAGGTRDVATFGGTAGTVSLSGTVTANRLQFDTSGYVLQNGTLNLNGNSPVIRTASVVSTSISSTVAGSAGLVKNGTGTLALSASNNYTGTTTVNEGTLTLLNTWASPLFHTEGGAVLDLNVSSGTRDAIGTTYTGRGTLRKTGAGELRWGSSIAVFNLGTGGLIDVQAGTLLGGSNANEDWTGNLADLNVAAGAIFSGVEANVRVDALSGSGTIRSGYSGLGYANFIFGVDHGSGTFAGTLANDSAVGHFTKTGSGTQILSGSNTYTGATLVENGTLLVNGSLSAASAVTVANNATLGGTGTAGTLTVQSGGTLAPGANGIGTFAVGAATGQGRLRIEIDGSTADRLNVSGNLDISQLSLDLFILTGGITSLDYVIATYGSLTGSQFAAVTGLPTGYQISIDAANKRVVLIGELNEAPRNLNALGGVGTVALGWQPTPGGSETTYQIERATASGGPFTAITSTATGNTYTDTTVADGSTYFYRVRVSASGSLGPVSNVASATTSPAGMLPPPITQTANIGGYGSPSVSYSSGSYTLTGRGLGATGIADSGYFLHVPVVGDCTIVARVGTLGTGGTTSRRAGVMIRQSLDAGAMEMATLVGPSQIQNTYRTSTGGNTSTSNTNSTTAPRWVRVVRSGNSLRGAQSADGVTWAQYTARTINMADTVYVGLWVSSGDTTTNHSSAFSNVSITGGSPTGLSATVGIGSVHLAWTSVTGAGGYNIKRATTSGGSYTTVATSTTNSFTDSPSADGTVYYYVVSATSGLGESANSNEVLAQPIPFAPSAPQGLTATGGENQIALEWSASATATVYQVKRGNSASGPFTQIGSTAATIFTDNTTTNGVVHHYVISAGNAGGTSADSASASAVSTGSGTWTANGNGNWSTAPNWQAERVAYGVGKSATFNQTAAVSINQDLAGKALGSVSVTGSHVALNGNGFTLATTSGTPSISVGSGLNLSVAGPLSGNQGMLLSGGGNLFASGGLNYSGSTSIDTANLTNSAAAGVSYSLGNLTLNGGTLAALNGGDAALGNFQLRGDIAVGGTARSTISADVRIIQNETRTFTVADTGDPSNIDLLVSGTISHQSGVAWGYAVKAGPGTMKISGPNGLGSFTVNEGRLILEDAGIAGLPFGLTNQALTELSVTAGNSVSFGTTMQGSGSFTKTGPGTLELIAVSSYTGGTIVDEGKLILATGNSAGTGRIRGALTVNAGGIVEATGDGTGLGWVDQISSVAITGGTLTSPGTIHIWNIPGGITMAGGLLQSNNGTSNPNGPLLEWNRTSLTTLASPNSSIIAGRIRMRNDGSYSGISFTVADGAATSDLLVSAAITEASSGMGIAKNGPGTLVLSGNNSYSGQTDITAGTLIAASSTALGVGGHNSTTMSWIRDGATLALQGGISSNEHFHVWGAGAGGLGAIRSISGNNSLTNSLNGGPGYCLRSDTTVGVEADSLTISGFYQDGGPFGIRKIGQGALNVGSFTATGAVVVAQGTVHMTGGHNNYSAPVATTVQAGAVLSNNTHSHIQGLTLDGGELAANGVDANWGSWMLHQHVTVTGSGTSVISAPRVAVANASNVSRIFDVAASATLNVTGTFENAYTTTANGLSKTGPGTMVLSAANSYTGPTSVSGGTLRVNGSTAPQSALTVSSNSILGGSGTVGGSITVNAGGTLAPGNSVGTLTAGSSVTLNGRLAIEIDGSAADRLNVTGNLNITNATLAISGNLTAQEYIIATFGSLTGPAFAAITGLPDGYDVDYSNNQIRLLAATPTFGSWIADNWPTLADKTPGGDPDNDGMENVLEYVLGGNPSQPDPGRAPTVTVSGGNLIFSFQRAEDSKTADVTLLVEAGSNMTTWPDVFTISPGPPSPGVSIVETPGSPDAVTVIIPQGNAAAKFARLRVFVAAQP
jgi:autotransporter-associated beta strand protein